METSNKFKNDSDVLQETFQRAIAPDALRTRAIAWALIEPDKDKILMQLAQSEALLEVATLAIKMLNDRVGEEAHVSDVGLQFAKLIAPFANTGKLFTAGRKPGTVGPIRKKIATLLKKNPTMKNPQLWDGVIANLPRNWTAFDNRQGKYLEGPNQNVHMIQRRFFTICGEERKKLEP